MVEKGVVAECGVEIAAPALREEMYVVVAPVGVAESALGEAPPLLV